MRVQLTFKEDPAPWSLYFYVLCHIYTLSSFSTVDIYILPTFELEHVLQQTYHMAISKSPPFGMSEQFPILAVVSTGNRTEMFHFML
jgi:hypothetical protein